MVSHFGWIFDVCIIAIIVYVIHSNAKRGATKVIVLSIGYIVASFAASLVSAAGAEAVYQSIAQRNTVSAIEAVNEKVDLPKAFKETIDKGRYGFTSSAQEIGSILQSEDRAHFDSQLYDYVYEHCGATVGPKSEFLNTIRDSFITAYGDAMDKKLPAYVRSGFEQAVQDDSEVMRKIVTAQFDSRMSVRDKATEIEVLFAKAPTVEVMRMFVYLILFSILMILAAVIAAVAENRLFLNLTKAKERFFGGVLGLLEVVAMLVLFTILVRLLVLIGGGDFLCFSDKAISNSFLFRMLYDNIPAML
ncbi:MAG: hypothetical protein IJ060_10600 [Oscillospiraceae bacterium]|nr:hypothetical protein [Oscillospiraceae bacterium]